MQTNTKYEIIKIDNKEVTFDVSNLASSKSLYINATEIAKKFNKQPKDWLRLKESQEYMEAISQEANLPLENLTNVIHGGTHRGTWLHSDLYIVFARWLNPTFAVKCDKKIREMLEGNHQPAISEHTLTQILHSNQETTMAIVQMNKNMETMFKTMLDTNNNMVRLKSEVREKLELTNHKLSNLQVSVSASQNASEQTKDNIEEIKEVVDKLEVYHRRDTLTSEQLTRIRRVIKEKARELAEDNNLIQDDAEMIIYSRLKSRFYVNSYYEIKSESFAKALDYIDIITLTREDIGE